MSPKYGKTKSHPSQSVKANEKTLKGSQRKTIFLQEALGASAAGCSLGEARSMGLRKPVSQPLCGRQN